MLSESGEVIEPLVNKPFIVVLFTSLDSQSDRSFITLTTVCWGLSCFMMCLVRVVTALNASDKIRRVKQEAEEICHER